MTARCVSLFMAATMALPTVVLANSERELAMEAYERSHYAESVSLLKRAAEDNDGRAQEMLGFMLLHGSALYGSAVPQDPAMARHWLQKAASQGSGAALHVLQKISRAAQRVSENITRP